MELRVLFFGNAKAQGLHTWSDEQLGELLTYLLMEAGLAEGDLRGVVLQYGIHLSNWDEAGFDEPVGRELVSYYGRALIDMIADTARHNPELGMAIYEVLREGKSRGITLL